MTPSNLSYNTVVLAGSPAQPDPLCHAEQVASKAVIAIDERPMIAYVLDALARSDWVGAVTVVGMDGAQFERLGTGHGVRCVPNHESIVDNLLAAIEPLEDNTPVLVVSSDIPLLTPEAVDDFCRRAHRSGSEFCYCVVERSTMEARFPGSDRSFRRLREGYFAGGDLFVATPRLLRTHAALMRQLSGQRKSAWGLVRIMGFGTVARYATHTLAIGHLEARASRLLGCTCSAIISPYPETAMDVDKPQQLALVRRIVADTPKP